MAFVITAPCEDERAAECVEVCPVDCIQIGLEHYLIDPDLCIDCGNCVSVCPVDAIYHEDDLLTEDLPYLEKARAFFNR
ncbi:indolepyruvate ferredoxin oxidoreductase subunit alpha [Bacillus norwichensis]|uniref:Ferredoxin n=1 Tax=Bacillus norwichensis TaxID=2762217 RepID=A0ABR8VS62_9BACI|nr:4Fe-4S binding protein [Bacillus norwichensis]MBD8007552.1 4Fe-4S binding protein [Bacillus norwichensis]